MIKIGLHIGLLIGGLVIATGSLAQTYSPIAVTGFNQDGIAESGIDATAVTSTALDLSSNIMYSTIFCGHQWFGRRLTYERYYCFGYQNLAITTVYR